MKKFGVLLLTAAMVLSLTACGETPVSEEGDSVESSTEESASGSEEKEESSEEAESSEAAESSEEVESSEEAQGSEESESSEEEAGEVAETVMTYADYMAASIDDKVVVETYVQAKQSWWDNKATVYTQDQDGAYFLYGMECTEEDYAKLTEGTKIKVTGYKTAWSGEIEIVDATFEILEGDTFVAEAVDATDVLADEEKLLSMQNQKVSFKDMTVVSVSYKNETPGDDIYVTLSKDDVEYSFCLEYYLNGSDEEFYNLVGGLEAGQVVDVEGFLYWYNGANTHLTSVTLK